jgi:threonine/homoserine/homoserine lactone efflux protein
MNDFVSIFCVSFGVALSGALMPGPLLAATIAESAGSGFRAGPLISLGHALLEGLLLAGLVVGLGGFLSSPSALAFVTVTGSLFLFVSGARMIAALPVMTIETASRRSSAAGMVAAGVAVSATNPYWWVWWMTIGLGFALSAGKAGLAGVTVFFFGHILADILWLSCVSFLIGWKRSFISTAIYRKILFVCSLTLIGFGIYFLLRIPLLLKR